MKYLTKSPTAAMAVSPPRIAPIVRLAMIAFVAFQIIPTQCSSQAPQTGLFNADGAAFNPATGKGYIVDSAGGAVHVSNNRDSTIDSVKVGANPTSIAVDTANGRAYVINAGDGTVSVLDGHTDRILTTLVIGAHPYSIAADSAAGKIYVTRTYSDQFMVIDAATNQVSGIKVGSPDLVAINEKTHTIYLLSYEMGDLVLLDAVTRNIIRTSVGMHVWGMALNQATGVLYIAKPGDGAVAVLAPGSITPTFIRIGGMPCAVAVNPQTNTVYAADYNGNRIVVIDSAQARVVATIPVGRRPEAIAVDARRNRAYAANTLDHSISLIDGITNKVIGTRHLSSAPYALSVDSTQGRILVATLGDSNFQVLAEGP